MTVRILLALVLPALAISPVRAAEPPLLVPQFGHEHGASVGTMTPNGRYVVTTGGVYANSTFCVWETASGRLVRAHRTPGIDSVDVVAVSPDATRVLFAVYNKVALCDTVTGRAVFEVKTTGVGLPSAAYAPDGKTVLFAGRNGFAHLYDASTGKELAKIDCTDELAKVANLYVTGVAYLADTGLVTALTDGRVLVWSADGKKMLRAVAAHEKPVHAVRGSRDGKRFATIELNGRARVWDAATGKRLADLAGPDGRYNADVALSSDGATLVTGHGGKGWRVWDVTTGKERPPRDPAPADRYTRYVALAPDGTRVLVALADGQAGLVDIDTRAEVRAFASRVATVSALAVAPDGNTVYASGHDGLVRRWDVRTGRMERVCRAHTGAVHGMALSSDGKLLLTVGADKMARLWEVPSGKAVRTLAGHTDAVHAAALSPKADLAVTGGYDNTARLWDVATGKELRRFGPNLSWMHSAAFTPDGTQVVTASPDVGQVELGSGPDETARLWDTATGKFVRRFDRHRISVEAITISPDGKHVLTGGGDKTARVWELATGKEVHRFEGHTDRVIAVAFVPGGKQVLTGGQDGTARLWSLETGKEVRRFEGHLGTVPTVATSADGARAFTGGGDGTVRVWDAANGKLLTTLIAFRDGNWLAAAPDGRFDASNLDDLRGVSWVAADEPLHPLAPETFMRDYFEPELFARVLAGEKLSPVRSVADLNRVQPVVRVSKVTPASGATDEVSVTVEVAGQERTFARPGGPVLVRSGAADLHLFRDGRLVALRAGALALDPRSGRASVTFDRVKLPRGGQKEVEFSAYAFNSDRVKSDTHRLAHALPALDPRKGTAYVVCVGVNGFDEPKWDLRFAAPDAKLMGDTLAAGLRASGTYDKVVVVTLLSEPTYDKGGKRTGVASTATKANVLAALAVLGGAKPDPALVRAVPAAADLRAARPEDAVILTFSTHGYNGPDGRFYLFPSDLGAARGREVTDELLKRAISTDELSDRLRGADAGELVLVADACHSAASVAADGFKPGPMGSRGLGQLAYDKRMRVLAASQADDVALEDDRVGHGLLTYALCKDGLGKLRADFDPADGVVSVGEWLRYGVRRVPGLADEVANGKTRAVSATGRALVPVDGKQSVAQLPALFDFTRGADDLKLTGKK